MTIFVYASDDQTDVLVGSLYSHRRRGSESATFRYNDAYLARPSAYALDPQLPLTSSALQTDAGQAIFRAMADGSPDRWGRNLILRRERLRARAQGTAERSFGELDLLLGVRDDLRQGSLRYTKDSDPTFMAPADSGVPVLTDLPKLLTAADRVTEDSATDDDLALLVKAGSSLGGARPKAHVLDTAGTLSIAKFPSRAADQWNVMAWEKTALDLARHADIDVSDSQLLTISGRNVLMVKRFDRIGSTRIGYASALTMLEATDGQPASYTDIALVIEQYSTSATAQLHQLWRRIAFTILISNSDDHLRNHGFLHGRGDVWELSPAFDINPDPSPGTRYLATAIDGGDPIASIDVLISAANHFRLRPDAARNILGEVLGACAGWRDVARINGLTGSEISTMQPAFEHEALARARSIVNV